MTPTPAALIEAARLATRTGEGTETWHIVLHRAGDEPRRGERLASLTLARRDIARVGAEAMARAGVLSSHDGDKLAVGRREVRAALDADRRRWVAACARQGYADGWGIAIVHEAGFARSVFPGVGLGDAARRRLAVPTSAR